MNDYKRTAIGGAIAAVGCVFAAVAVIGVSGAASATSPPPWVGTDSNEVGGLEFFNASGQEITGGNLTDNPLAAYIVGTTAVRSTGDVKATLYGYLPNPSAVPGAWSGEVLSASTIFPNVSAPAPVNGTALPVVTEDSNETTIGGLTSDYPQSSSTAGYVNTYELRLKTSGGTTPGVSQQYDYADITVNTTAGTWAVAYTPAGSIGPTPTPTPTVTPTVTPTPTPTPTTSTPTTATPTPTPSASGSGSSTPTPSSSAPSSSGSSSSSSSSATPTPSASSTGASSSSASSQASTTAASSPTVAAIGPDGSPLSADPTLTPGENVALTAGGFAAYEAVDVTLHSTEQELGTVAADSTGTVDYSFTVPAGLPAGTHHVEFAGTSQQVEFAFTIKSGVDAVSASGGGLSSTGFDTALFGGFGAALIAAGGLVALRARPRLATLRGRHAR
jgi:hypothetical protein